MALYVDYMSQPSRACAIFCRVTGQNVKEVVTLIHKLEHLKLHPFGKVPLLEVPLQEGGLLRLPESAAILSYLADTKQVPEHWLPRSDRAARAQVEAAMHWWHGTIRAGAMRLMFNKVIAIKLKRPASEALAQEGYTILKRSLVDLEKRWLEQGAKRFVCGSQICLADLLLCCELEQLTMLNKERHGVDMDELLAPHPHVRTWMAAVARATAPHYELVHSNIRKAAAADQGCQSPALASPQPRL